MKNNAIKYRVLYVTLFFAAFSACQQPETPVKKPSTGPGTSATPVLEQLEIYDDTDKENPLALSNSNINTDTNIVTAHESAEAIFVVVKAQYPTETEIDIFVGSMHKYPPGLEGDGIPLTKNLFINISVEVLGTLNKKTYSIGVIKGAISDIERELVTEPIGAHAIYWNGTGLPLNENKMPIEDAGYDTIETAWNAILEGGSGTADNPDIIMLGSDIKMKSASSLNMAGRHIKITVPPSRKYTIGRNKDETGLYYNGTFFNVNAAGASLTLTAEDLENTNGKVDSMLVLDGGAVWSAPRPDEPTGGANNAGTNATNQPMIAVSNGGILNMERWVVIQNFNAEQAVTGAINVGGVGSGTFNMHGGTITKNKSRDGALVLNANGTAHISGGSFEYNSTSGTPIGGGAIYMHAVAPPPQLTISGGVFIGNMVHIGNASQGGGAIYVGSGTLTIANPQTLAILEGLDGTPGSYVDAPTDPLPGHWMSAIENVDFSAKESFIEYQSMSSFSAPTANLTAYTDSIAAAGFILFKGNSSKAVGGETGGGTIMINSTATITGEARIFDALFEDSASMANGGAISAKNKDGYVIKNSIFRYNNASPTNAADVITGGGAIRNNIPARIGLIRLDNVLFTHNTAFKGGALYHTTPATETDTGTKNIVITNGVFTENEAKSTTPNTGFGGAILFSDVYNAVKIAASHFEDNTAKTGGGAIAFMGVGPVDINGGAGNLTKILNNTAGSGNSTGGGGLYIHRVGTITVDYTEIRDNTAKGAATGIVGGGGVLYTGGDVVTYPLLESTVEFLDNVVIAGNMAGDAANDTAYGGGIYNSSVKGTVVLADGATVGGTAAADANYAKRGGGIAVKGTSILDDSEFAGLRIVRSLPANSKPKVIGNGAVTVDGSEKITLVGGGIYTDGHVSLEIAGEVSNNKAVNGGGGIFVELNADGRTTDTGNFPKVNLASGALIKNNAVTEQDYSSGTPYKNGGGGIHILRSGEATNSYLLFTMNDEAEISNNQALRGAGIYLYNVAFFADPGITNFDTAGFVMSGGSIKENVVSSHSAAVGVMGGGVYLSGSDTPSLADSQKTGFCMTGGSIEGNKALGTLAAGGGVFLDNSIVKFIFKGGEIKKNEAGRCGGGVSIGNVSGPANIAGIKFAIDGGHFVENKAGTYGGAIFMYSTEPNVVTFTSGSFANNQYTNTVGNENGHTVYVSTSSMQIGVGNTMTLTSASGTYNVIDGDSAAYVYVYPEPAP